MATQTAEWSLKRAVTGLRNWMPREVVRPPANLYESLSIGPDEIRLLKIQPAASWNSPVTASLFTAKRDDFIKYDALSYMWGDANDKGTIYVNGRPTEITRSLHTALAYLRLSDKEAVLWADSICIDQENAEEKNQQVSKMSEIYSNAEFVRIWLGEAGQDTDLAMSVVNGCTLKMTDEELIERLFRDEKSSMGLIDVLSRPYWFRMWMFQEVLLARRAFVHCGTSKADWSMFVRADGAVANMSRQGQVRGGWVDNLRKTFFNITQFTIPPSVPTDADTILFLSRRLQATDPKDKIYGLLGVCDLGRYVTVDYSKSARDVYMEYARNFCRTTGDLRLLCSAGPWDDRNGEDIGLPSWTPDFRGKEGLEPMFVAAAHDKSFDACKGRRYEKAGQDECDDGVLMAEGFVIDTIDTTMPWARGDVSRKQLLERYGIGNKRGGRPGRSQLKSLCDALVFDRNRLRPDASEDDTQFKQLLGLLRDAEMLGVIRLDGMNAESGSTWLGYDLDIDFRLLAEEYLNLRKTNPGVLDEYRASFLSEVDESRGIDAIGFKSVGNYIGRTTRTGKVGDVIAVLYGSHFPVVLRQMGSGTELRYQFI